MINWVLPPSRFFRLKNFLLGLSSVQIGEGVSICGNTLFYGGGDMTIGEQTWISPGFIVHTHLEAEIKIGRSCDIGPRVELITGSHQIGDGSRRAGLGTASSIYIGDGCWIGARSIILGGISVGNGSVIAAGSVVTNDVEPDCLYAGIPARLKRRLS
jgi:maltose O-acetyltransferase